MRLYRFQELFFVDFTVGVEVDASNDCEVVSLSRLAPLIIEEPLEIFNVYFAHGAVVNRDVAALGVVTLACLKLLFNLFSFTVHSNLIQK